MSTASSTKKKKHKASSSSLDSSVEKAPTTKKQCRKQYSSLSEVSTTLKKLLLAGLVLASVTFSSKKLKGCSKQYKKENEAKMKAIVKKKNNIYQNLITLLKPELVMLFKKKLTY